MRLKLKWIIPLVLLLILIIVYRIPTPHKSYETLASDVPKRQGQLYQGFKNQNAIRRLVVNGLTWEYIVTGPNKEAVLFLHGMTGAADIWWQQIYELRMEYKLISVTFPPAGSLEELSRGIIAILDSESVSTVNLVGTSLGGYLAQYLIAQYPERVQRAVLSNTFPPNDLVRKDNRLFKTVLPFLPEWVIMRTLQGTITNSIYPASRQDPFTRAYLLALASGGTSKAQIISRYQAVTETFTPADPMEYGIPVMIIESDNDPLVSENLRALLRQTYPFANVYRFSGAGSFPYLNQWDTFDDLLIRFFREPAIE